MSLLCWRKACCQGPFPDLCKKSSYIIMLTALLPLALYSRLVEYGWCCLAYRVNCITHPQQNMEFGPVQTSLFVFVFYTITIISIKGCQAIIEPRDECHTTHIDTGQYNLLHKTEYMIISTLRKIIQESDPQGGLFKV